ncbi:MAG: thiamine-phosphate kinase [Elusimicrobia bacterium RIFOXYA1_FULL_47_7]|nr:MAG: thiamine-phosphate kinase [Elusimicrobia bacterium RIFOXYA12_FULL_49_49]OGS09148.1 MAG: thiamine-phosphate kinase [Elusimicrobia bacterium RIFOXYA1_FULL_47_7]OGS11542.1 MAG: thiamine-phosphate kinase [Elusimicrobia bacterium RIFOXYB1_FULL_48_9]OGS14770.1 MAG: thiamine-phosphate kinase [Elusimicrobia bacterium RIFOXYA2_FULL_47_53]OGS28946.1 MAG: thiamine-phosphate kinase [Elusimicrobia bacterium RIFOXYB2_FULL_46_23]
MKIKEIGEFGLIDRLLKGISRGKESRGLFIGPGDDAFAAVLPPRSLLVGTKDLLVEGVHFKRSWASPEKIGYKSMAVNLSDLAAMGAVKPLFALVGIALPSSAEVKFVEGLYSGMRRAASKYGFAIAGGDTVSSKEGVVISITMLGSAKASGLVRRGGARPGDLIIATGTFGDSGAGLWLLSKGIKPLKPEEKYLIEKHLAPHPLFSEAAALSKYATSLIDSSDGLDKSVNFIAKGSGAGARIDIEKIPLSRQLLKVSAARKNLSPVNQALTGAEEYELVATVPPDKLKALKSLVRVTVIGRITKGEKVEYYYNGRQYGFSQKGFEHFK